ncbi:MAG TPA: hypothetical protein VNS80_04590 [Pseudolysinimonas sp.]|nr:hypothetical protein [Pseudolysinimonas sp.]
MPNAMRRILTLLGAIALLLGVAVSLGGTANAATAEGGPVATPTSPVDGATVPAGHVLLTWTSPSPVTSYDVRWGTVEELGPDGLLLADDSVSGLTNPWFDIPNLADLTYYWQVRAIGVDGAVGPWSASTSFTVLAGTGEGEQLDTLTPEGADTSPEKPTHTPVKPGGWAAVDGILYLAVASSFAIVLLAVVVRAWLHRQREV